MTPSSVTSLRVFVLNVLVLSWVVAASVVLFAQSRGPDIQTQLFVEQRMNANSASIAQVRQDVAVLSSTLATTTEELKEMRMAVWGCAGTILLSLVMQLTEIRKRRGVEKP